MLRVFMCQKIKNNDGTYPQLNITIHTVAV